MNNLTKLRRTPHTSTIFQQKLLPDFEKVQATKAQFLVAADAASSDIDARQNAWNDAEKRLEDTFIDYLNVLFGAR